MLNAPTSLVEGFLSIITLSFGKVLRMTCGNAHNGQSRHRYQVRPDQHVAGVLSYAIQQGSMCQKTSRAPFLFKSRQGS